MNELVLKTAIYILLSHIKSHILGNIFYPWFLLEHKKVLFATVMSGWKTTIFLTLTFVLLLFQFTLLNLAADLLSQEKVLGQSAVPPPIPPPHALISSSLFCLPNITSHIAHIIAWGIRCSLCLTFVSQSVSQSVHHRYLPFRPVSPLSLTYHHGIMAWPFGPFTHNP